MNLISVVLCLSVVSDLFLVGSSVPTRNAPKKFHTAAGPVRGIIQENRRFSVGGKVIDLYWDWRVNLNEYESSDIIDNAFRIDFRDRPKAGSSIFIILEAGMAVNDEACTVEVPVFQSVDSMVIIPKIYFPRTALSQAIRIYAHVRVPSRVRNMVMIDAPSASEIRKHEFAFRYWKLNQAIIGQRDNSPRVQLNWKRMMVSENPRALNVMDEVFEAVMGAGTEQLKNKLNALTAFSYFDSKTSPASDTFVFDRTDPKVRMMTALSWEIAHSRTGQLSESPETNRHIEIMPQSRNTKSLRYFRFIGRIIGIAIANELQFNAPISPVILDAIRRKPEDKKSLGHKFRGVLIAKPDGHVIAHLDSLCKGVWDVVPRQLLEPFSDKELGVIISGRTDLSVSDLKNWVQYEGSVSEKTVHVQWFWEYVSMLTHENLLTVWEIISGSPRLPPSDFIGDKLKFTIMTYPVTEQVSTNVKLPFGFYRSFQPSILFAPMYSSQEKFKLSFDRAVRLRSA